MRQLLASEMERLGANLNASEAQKFLAERLPELIYYQYLPACKAKNPYEDSEFELPEKHLFVWNKLPTDSISGIVHDTEFDYIARLVEGRVMADYNLGYYYHMALRQLWVDTEKNDTFEWWLIKLDYVQRATALKQTIGEE